MGLLIEDCDVRPRVCVPMHGHASVPARDSMAQQTLRPPSGLTCAATTASTARLVSTASTHATRRAGVIATPCFRSRGRNRRHDRTRVAALDAPAIASATIRLRRLEFGGREGRDPFRAHTTGRFGARTVISGVIPVRRETSGVVGFPRGLVAPVAAGQARRSARGPRPAPGSSRRRRTGLPARRRGTSAAGGGKARPPSRGCWPGGGRGRFGSSILSFSAPRRRTRRLSDSLWSWSACALDMQ